ncbi:hypothetical protein NUW54_g2540 [Trametes sanguinea]|uniref:Uncharacterized protein n=1 Tax=Trametes sanguinea TaxID=158606 RepID=A0ACC1Q3V3_9APHY|nr:hypothetical protein NUW54_g2540 [Trametes sanguinea]
MFVKAGLITLALLLSATASPVTEGLGTRVTFDKRDGIPYCAPGAGTQVGGTSALCCLGDHLGEIARLPLALGGSMWLETPNPPRGRVLYTCTMSAEGVSARTALKACTRIPIQVTNNTDERVRAHYAMLYGFRLQQAAATVGNGVAGRPVTTRCISKEARHMAIPNTLSSVCYQYNPSAEVSKIRTGLDGICCGFLVPAASNPFVCLTIPRSAPSTLFLLRQARAIRTMSIAQLPAKMQAIGINKTGDFDVIEKLELPVPQNAPGNVLVKVHYGGVNFIDTYYRKGLYPISSFPQPLGTEAAGEVVGLPTDDKVLNDEEYKLRGFKLGTKVAVYGLGSFAEYVSVPWAKTYPLPDGVSTRTAAAGLTQEGRHHHLDRRPLPCRCLPPQHPLYALRARQVHHRRPARRRRASPVHPPLRPSTSNGCLIGGSHIGSKEDMMEMLQLAADKGIKPWIQELPMKEAGKALEGVKAGKVRYRYVLQQDIAPVA